MQVLSLSRNISELDRMESDRRLALGCYTSALHAAAKHAVRADTQAAEEFRKNLLQLAERLESSGTVALSGALNESRKAFNDAQQTFQQQTEQHVEDLRRNLAATNRMVKEMMAHLSGIGTRHHENLQHDIEGLRQLQAVDSLEKLRTALGDMASRMTARLENLQREHQLTVTQLQDEIRALHRQLEERPKPAPAPSAQAAVEAAPDTARAEFTGMRRAEFENALKLKTENGETYCLTLIWMSNLAHLFTRHEADVVLELMTAANLRLAGMVSGNRLWTRWEDDVFVVCTSQSKGDAGKFSQDLVGKLNGTYRINKGGKADHVQLQIEAGLVERSKDDSFDRVVQKAGQLLKSLRSIP